VAGRRGRNGAAACRALVARVPCGRAAASGVRARAHSSGGGGQRRDEAVRRQQAQRARGSGAASARAGALKCLRAQRGERRARERERGERKGVERERERSTGFDSKIIQIFVLKLQKV